MWNDLEYIFLVDVSSVFPHSSQSIIHLLRRSWMIPPNLVEISGKNCSTNFSPSLLMNLAMAIIAVIIALMLQCSKIIKIIWVRQNTYGWSWLFHDEVSSIIRLKMTNICLNTYGWSWKGWGNHCSHYCFDASMLKNTENNLSSSKYLWMVLASVGLHDCFHLFLQQLFVSKSGKRHSISILILLNFGWAKKW